MTRTDPVWPAVVIGAGAAGLAAAVFAGRGGVPVLLVETRPKPGAKIRVSGGGRCNLLPSTLALDDFDTSGSRHTLRNVLMSWPLDEVRAFFERDLGIALKVEDTGKVFPQSDDAREVVAALLAECARVGAALLAPWRTTDVRREERDGAPVFVLESDRGERLWARRVVLATGGLSLPKSGSDGGGMAIARRLGHALVPTYPALVSLVTAEGDWRELAGVSVPVRLTAERGGRALESREGSLLFTHRGVSGPAVLDISHRMTRPETADVRLRVCWGAVPDWEALLLEAHGRTRAGTLVRSHLPHRLATRLLQRAGVDADRPVGGLGRDDRRRLVAVLADTVLPLAGNEGYRTAEVTGGGVPLAEVSAKTLESRRVPGLYLCGEILDATGRLGGYNFLWAWVTGRKVGVALSS